MSNAKPRRPVMKNILRKFQETMMAATFAEAGEWDTAREMAPVTELSRDPTWLNRIFMAITFAESGLHDEAIRFMRPAAGGNKLLPAIEVLIPQLPKIWVYMEFDWYMARFPYSPTAIPFEKPNGAMPGVYIINKWRRDEFDSPSCCGRFFFPGEFVRKSKASEGFSSNGRKQK
jgi:hypothetical protein